MEIVGFKSFADRTKIEFDKGVTAIVGPNGSGKSNIVESLRWVLGEQSAKSLRGGKMPDVIFAGTEKRRALNYAEVISTFDNIDQYLQGHDEDEEVIIARRLYRNGDSEFLINGRKCRLRDIHDLFTDTGLGRDSLSIISQGRIESVFNSKPEERRAIFEEAAGVLKYKNRRQETESKLKGTQDNLDRLEDIIHELNGQLEPLRAQRDTAIRFKDLENQRLQLDLSVLVAQLLDEKNKYDQSKVDFETVLKELEELADKHKSYEEELVELKQKRATVEEEQEKIQSETLTLTTLKSDIQNKIEIFDLQKSNSEKNAEERQARLKDLKDKKKEVEHELASHQSKNGTLKEEEKAYKEKITKLEAELQSFSESPEAVMERVRDEYLKLVQKEADLNNQLTRNKADMENINRQISEQDESSQANQKKYDALSKEIESEESKHEALKKSISSLLESFQVKQQEENQIQSSEKQATDTMYEQIDTIKSHKARLSSLENIRDNHSNLYQGVRAVMQATSQKQLSGVIGVVADLLSFDNKYTTAMDIALGGGSQNIIVEDENAAKNAISYLRDKRLGRATLLPLTTIKPRDFRQYDQVSKMKGFIDTAINLVKSEPRLNPALSNLLGTTVIVDTAENATNIARSMGYSIRIVTLDGTQINPGGSYSGGAGKRNSTTFTQSEIENLQKEIAQLESKLKETENSVKKLAQQHETINQALENLKTAGEEKRFEENGLTVKIQQLKENQKELEEFLALNGNAQSDNLQFLSEKNQEIKIQLEEIISEKDKLDQHLEEIRTSSHSFNQLKEEKNQELIDLNVQLSQVNAQIGFSQSEMKRLLADNENLEEEQEKIKNLSDSSISSSEREQLVLQLKEVEEKLQAFNVKLVSQRFERDDLVAQLEELEESNQDFIKENQELYNKKTRLEFAIEQSEKVLHSKQQRLTSDYEMSFDEAESKADDLESLAQAEDGLRQIERQIRALGPVNIEAITQFGEVNERYEFLSGQKEDLLEAKDMLLTTIGEMNEEVEVRFKSTFEQIKNSFRTTFTQMFSGGTAELELTSDNLLEAGVEINVQPPGKKLASLNLMSGGEKALTALALIFAILRVRTVPFVVLDEVEAALDEANVKRFGDYMKHFDNSNQFIVVTHRRGTMASAGAMYGVTMADAGVSKMISVRLENEK